MTSRLFRPSESHAQARPGDGLPPPETPAEAARRMLERRKLSSKINYHVLADLFEEDAGAGSGSGDGGWGDSE